MTTKKRHILRTAPVAIAVVLSVAACGSPFKSGSSGAAAPSDTSSGAALSTGSTGSTGTATTPSPGASSGSSFGAGGGSAAAGSATPGQAGTASGGFGNTDPAAGLTPDQVAAYCTGFPYDPDLQTGKAAADSFIALRKNTPVQLVPNVDVMISDNQAIASEKRVYAQLKDEMVANFKPLQDFHDQICIAH